MNVSLYWGIEYTKVLLGYLFIMFIWPSVVFRNYFRGKSLILRFSLCVTIQVVLVNTVVLMLGLFHILTPWIFRILFYGSFIWSAFRNVKIGKEELNRVRYLLTGTYGFRLFFLRVITVIHQKSRQAFDVVTKKLYSHWWECGLLGIVVIYGMIYFSHGAFQDYSYGFGDLYPHHSWVYGLTQGQIFSNGVYPEAMHCFVYALHVLFGIRIYNCLLFLAGIHSGVYLISAYVLMRTVFKWRFTPMLVLTLFLTVDLLCIDEVFSMSRLQWTLPQEFGLYTQYLCAAFLIRYLRSENRITRKGKLSKHYWDANLLVFMMALAASLAIHFYVTIMAFFLCASFVPMLLRKIFRKKYFVPLVVAVVCGFSIAVIPMGGALLSGIPFQGSIGWAVNVINGTDPEQAWTPPEETEDVVQPSPGQSTPGTSDVTDIPGQGITGTDQNPGQGQFVATETVVEQESPSKMTVLKERWQSLSKRVKKMAKGVWEYSYVTLYYSERAKWILGFTVLAFGLWLLCRFIIPIVNLSFLKKTERKKIPGNYFDHYFSMAFASFVFMFMYSSKYIGLPPLIAESRLCSTSQMLNLAMMAVPVDLLFFIVSLIMPLAVMKLAAVFCAGGIYVGTILTGTFHGYLYYELTRYNEAVMATISITQQLPRESYTIVSTVDELYPLIQYGWHEELVNFVNKSTSGDYTLPTPYVFLFIEKKPLQYGQSHFFTGPEWLACEKYPQYYVSYVSQCPDVTSMEISEEFAADPRTYYWVSSDIYSDMRSRTILESKLYKWCEQFSKLYPNELKVYCESDNFICYYFEQNVQRKYQLGFMRSGGAE